MADIKQAKLYSEKFVSVLIINKFGWIAVSNNYYYVVIQIMF